MKKHSPNFHTNLEEADKAKNNRAKTFGWVYLLIVVFLIGLSVTKTKAQSSEDTLVINPYYRVMPQPVDSSKLRKFIYSDTSRYLFGTVIDDGSPVQIRTSDTIPVIMMVSDTTNSDQQRQMFSLNDIDTVKLSGGYFAFPQFKNSYTFEISTPMHYQPYIIYGYEVKECEYYSPKGTDLKFRTRTTTYLNHLKQPLPDRIIVWMAIRRNEK